DVIGIAAGAEDAEEARLRAELLLPAPADRAVAAADPREDDAPLAGDDSLGLGPGRQHLAHRLVAHGERQPHAALGQLQPLAAAEIVMPFPEMDVAVADAGGEDAEQHLAALRARR